MTEKQNCAECTFRKKYDDNPKSILGRIWRWHVSWCPGWKAYMKSLNEEDRSRMAQKYDLSKFQS